MSLEQWAANGWLHRHETNAQEIAELFRIVGRDLEDGSLEELSVDWRFGIAYNAENERNYVLRVSHSG